MFTQDEARGMATDTLVALFDATLDTTALGVVKTSIILAELDARNALTEQMRTFTKSGPFKHFREVASGRLAPRLALACSDPSLVQGLLRVPMAAQENIADGQLVPVAEQVKGEIRETEKSIWRLDCAEIARVFGEKGIRTAREQAHILRAEASGSVVMARSSDGRIGVDSSSETLRFGAMKVKVADLAEPLRMLGFRLVRISKGPKSDAA